MNIIKLLRDVQTMKMLLKVTIMTPTIKAYIMHMKKNVIDLSSNDSSFESDGEGHHGHHHGHSHTHDHCADTLDHNTSTMTGTNILTGIQNDIKLIKQKGNKKKK